VVVHSDEPRRSFSLLATRASSSPQNDFLLCHDLGMLHEHQSCFCKVRPSLRFRFPASFFFILIIQIFRFPSAGNAPSVQRSNSCHFHAAVVDLQCVASNPCFPHKQHPEGAETGAPYPQAVDKLLRTSQEFITSGAPAFNICHIVRC